MPDQANPSELAVRFSLSVILIVISVGGNAIIGALLIRFQKLRTIPNILIANMALVDLLNSVINMPLAVVMFVLREQFTSRGKALAFATGSVYILFGNLNLFSMILLAADRYGAIGYGMKYMLWKTPRKAFMGVGLVWSLSFVFTAVNYVPFLDLDIPNGTVAEYRRAQFMKTGRLYALVTIPLMLAVLGILSVLTWYTLSHARRKLPGIQDLSTGVRQKREMNDVKATKTLFIAFGMYFFCYLPTIILSVCVSRGYNVAAGGWFGFFGMFSPFVSSACNPIIYALRTGRFRHAIRKLCKDPCGKSPLQEVREVKKTPSQGKKPEGQTGLAQRRNGLVPTLDLDLKKGSDEGGVNLQEVNAATEKV